MAYLTNDKVPHFKSVFAHRFIKDRLTVQLIRCAGVANTWTWTQTMFNVPLLTNEPDSKVRSHSACSDTFRNIRRISRHWTLVHRTSSNRLSGHSRWIFSDAFVRWSGWQPPQRQECYSFLHHLYEAVCVLYPIWVSLMWYNTSNRT